MPNAQINAEPNAQAYGEWLLSNADKKGTPDFELVADAYRAARQITMPKFERIPEEPGFFKSLTTGATSAAKSLVPAAKLMAAPGDEAAAEQLRNSQKEAQEAYKHTEFSDIGKLAKEGDIGGAIGATFSKFKELAGESIGFQAPAAAAGALGLGAAAVVGAPAALAGTAAYGLTLLGQYIASNLGRQVEENKGKPVDRLSATVAGTGQTALDLLGGKFLGLGKLVGLEGKEAAKQTIKELEAAALNPIKYKEEVAKGIFKGIAFEMPQEVTQQFLERWQAGLDTNPFNSPDAAKEYLESAAGALMLGGPLGAIGGVGAARKTRGDAVTELGVRAKEEQAKRDEILAGADNAPYSEIFTGQVEGKPLATDTQQGLFTPEAAPEPEANEIPPVSAYTPSGEKLTRDQVEESQIAKDEEVATIQSQLPEQYRVYDVLTREIDRAATAGDRTKQVTLIEQRASVEKSINDLRGKLKKLGEEAPTRLQEQKQAEVTQPSFDLSPPAEPTPPAPAPTPVGMQINNDSLTQLGFSKTSKKARTLLDGLDLSTTDGINTFEKHLGDLSKRGVKFDEQAASDLIDRARETQTAQKTKSITPTIIGGEAAPDTTANALEIAKQKQANGLPLTPVDAYALKNQPTQKLILPENKEPEPLEVIKNQEKKVSPLQLQPSNVPQPKVEESNAPSPKFVTETDIDRIGIGNSSAAAKLREQLLAKDLNDPVDFAAVQEALNNFSKRAGVTKNTRARINNFINQPVQTGFNFEESQNVEQRTTEPSNVAPVPQPDAGRGTTEVAGDTGVAATTGATGTDNVRQTTQQSTLGETNAPQAAQTQPIETSTEKESTPSVDKARTARGILRAAGVPASEWKSNIEDVTDTITGEIDLDTLQKSYPDKLALSEKPVGAKLSTKATEETARGNIKSALEDIVANGSSPQMRDIAKRILRVLKDTKIRIADIDTMGEYDPATNTITINPNALYEHTLLHEALHAAISHVLRNNMHPLTRQLNDIFNKVRSRLGGHYGAINLQEFAAESQSNPEFRQLLKNIPMKGKVGNALDAVINAIRKFLGFPPRKTESVLDSIDKTINDILGKSASEPRTAGDILFMEAMPSGASAAYARVLNTLGSQANSAPKFSPDWVSKLGGLSRGLVSAAVKTLDLNHIVEIYGDRVPALKTMITLINKRYGYERTELDTAGQIDRSTQKLVIKYNKTPALKVILDKFTDMAYDATINRYDPSNPTQSGDPKSAKGPALDATYKQLPDDLKEAYKDIKNHYAKLYKDYIAAMEKDLAVLPQAERDAIRAEIEGAIKPYFPLMRFGDYWLEFSKNGVRHVTAFETPEIRNAFIEANKVDRNHPDFKQFKNLQEVTADRSPPSSPMIQKVLKTLKDNGADKTMVDEVYRNLLRLYPQQSAVMNMIKREGTPGYEKDILRSYGALAPRLISQTASRMYNGLIQEAAALGRGQLSDISNKSPQGYDAMADAVASQISGEEGSRLNTILNPSISKLASNINWLTYTYFLAGNVSSVVMNATQIPIVTYPMLAGKYGAKKAFNALFDAYKIYGKFAYKDLGENFAKYGYLSPLNSLPTNHPLAKLYKGLQENGQINISISQEILGMRTKPTSKEDRVKQSVQVALSFAHQHSEMANREVTAIATYNLAKQAGRTDAQALQEAIDVVTQSQGSGMIETAGTIFQSPVGRTVLMFKRFSQLMMFRAARMTYVAIKGDSSLSANEQELAKSIARKQLIGTFALSFAFAGAQGVPFYGLLEFMYGMFQAAFGDKYSYKDFNNEVRNSIGEFAYKGPANYLTGLEIASRTGFSDLIVRDDARSKAELGPVRYYFEQFFLGAPMGMLSSINNGAKMIGEGNWYRGIEAMSPAVVRNGLKGMRFSLEGARTLKGDPIDENIGVYSSLMQMGGFAPAGLVEKYERRTYAKELEKHILQSKQGLYDAYEIALEAGDFDSLGTVMDRVSEFNSAYPEVAITPKSIKASMARRQKQEMNAIYGVQINPKLMSRVREEAGVEE